MPRGAFDELTLALRLDHRSLALVPSPLGLAKGVKTSAVPRKPQLDLETLFPVTPECTVSYPQSQQVMANCLQEGVIGN